MKTRFHYLLAFGFILLLAGCECDSKVRVCHKGKIINIDKNASRAHYAHGDAFDLDDDGFFGGDNACTAPDCNDKDPKVIPTSEGCTPSTCSITALTLLNATCTDPTHTYDLQLRVTYANAPASGTLDVTIDGALTSFAITTSPQIVNVFGLPPTGVDVNVTASFSATPTCNLVANALYEAPDCGL